MTLQPEETLEEYNRRKLEEAHAAWQRANPFAGKSMPQVSQMIFSKYISQADVPAPRVVTIRAVSLENMSRRPDNPEQRWVMWFHEMPKCLKLNNTTLRFLEKMLGNNSDAWIGRRVQLYVDPSVTFGGQMVGGVRMRVGKAAGAPQIPGQATAPARFDPYTGQPITTPQAPPPRFDPYTGKPIGTVNPHTGEITPETPSSNGADPEFDDDIPF